MEENKRSHGEEPNNNSVSNKNCEELGPSCLRMFEDGVLCDVTLVVGKEKKEIQAHKFILVARSQVFRAMFCGRYTETHGRVEIPDIEPDILQTALRYMYTDKFEEPTMATIFDLLYTAEKYELKSFGDKCEKFLQQNIKIQNFCTILNHAIMYDKKALLNECLIHSAYLGNQIVNSEKSLSLSNESMQELLKSDYFTADESKIFKACMKWAKNECENRKLIISRVNVKKCLGKILQLIRFCSMSIETFSSQVCTEKLLTDKEKVVLFQSIINKSEDYKQFNFSGGPPRNAQKSICLVTSEAFLESCLLQLIDCLVIRFNQDTSIIHVYVILPKAGRLPYKGTIQLTVRNQKTQLVYQQNHTPQLTTVQNVGVLHMLPVLRLKANTDYRMLLKYEGTNLSYRTGRADSNTYTIGKLTLALQTQSILDAYINIPKCLGHAEGELIQFYGFHAVIE